VFYLWGSCILAQAAPSGTALSSAIFILGVAAAVVLIVFLFGILLGGFLLRWMGLPGGSDTQRLQAMERELRDETNSLREEITSQLGEVHQKINDVDKAVTRVEEAVRIQDRRLEKIANRVCAND
jgi:hypothetical protein